MNGLKLPVLGLELGSTRIKAVLVDGAGAPLASGACTAIGGNVVTDAFGIVALVALAPLIAIQIMGLIYAHKAKSVPQPSQQLSDDTVVELEEE